MLEAHYLNLSQAWLCSSLWSKRGVQLSLVQKTFWNIYSFLGPRRRWATVCWATWSHLSTSKYPITFHPWLPSQPLTMWRCLFDMIRNSKTCTESISVWRQPKYKYENGRNINRCYTVQSVWLAHMCKHGNSSQTQHSIGQARVEQ